MYLPFCINQTEGRGCLRLKASNTYILLSSPIFCILILGLQGQKGTKGESGVPGKVPASFSFLTAMTGRACAPRVGLVDPEIRAVTSVTFPQSVSACRALSLQPQTLWVTNLGKGCRERWGQRGWRVKKAGTTAPGGGFRPRSRPGAGRPSSPVARLVAWPLSACPHLLRSISLYPLALKAPPSSCCFSRGCHQGPRGPPPQLVVGYCVLPTAFLVFSPALP